MRLGPLFGKDKVDRVDLEKQRERSHTQLSVKEETLQRAPRRPKEPRGAHELLAGGGRHRTQGPSSPGAADSLTRGEGKAGPSEEGVPGTAWCPLVVPPPRSLPHRASGVSAPHSVAATALPPPAPAHAGACQPTPRDTRPQRGPHSRKEGQTPSRARWSLAHWSLAMSPDDPQAACGSERQRHPTGISVRAAHSSGDTPWVGPTCRDSREGTELRGMAGGPHTSLLVSLRHPSSLLSAGTWERGTAPTPLPPGALQWHPGQLQEVTEGPTASQPLPPLPAALACPSSSHSPAAPGRHVAYYLWSPTAAHSPTHPPPSAGPRRRRPTRLPGNITPSEPPSGD